MNKILKIILIFKNIFLINSCCNSNDKNEKNNEINNENKTSENIDKKKDEQKNKDNNIDLKKKELDNLIKKSVDNTKVIKEIERLGEMTEKNNDCKIEMKKDKTIDSALYYIKNNPGCKIGILNFANWKGPCGSQEGSIRNATTLDNNLYCKESKKKFYNPHKEEDEKIANDDIIYSPDVIILKDDSGKKLDDFNNKVDVISCAAPNNTDEDIPEKNLKDIQKKRMTKILMVADKKNIEILILGAFGCGVFKNPTKLVADVYSEILKDKMNNFKTKFKKIVFAIPDENYDIFYNVFNNFTFD